jgi:tripartite-type tricarboxylate transporter receptor subunit TctC
MNKLFCAGLFSAALAVTAGPVAAQEWKPAGPINLTIGFKAGGGTDTQARLIGEALTAKKGWKFNYKNVAGKGGANTARVIKDAPKDGLSIGMAVTSTFTHSPLISDKTGYTDADFTYIVTTAPTQIGLVARTDSGWKSIDDMVAAAKAKKLKIAIMGPTLGDAAHVISQKYGIKFANVKVKGGRGVLNGLMAKDVDLGFIAGIHAKAVKSGDLMNLASAENDRLTMSPDVPTLKELGIPYQFGITFIVFGPKDMDPAARDGIAKAFAEVLSDPNEKATQFVNRAFGKPPLVTGADLVKQIADETSTNKVILSTIN